MKPQISVIVITPDDWTNMRRTLAALRAQTVASDLEVVLVGPNDAALDLPPALVAPFAAVRKVIFDHPQMGHATAQGVRAASTDLILLTEDHCYPMPDFVAAMLACFEDPDVIAVGPTVVNGNPRTVASWTQFIVEYGSSSHAGTKGQARQIPGHNGAYRRSALLHYASNLDEQLEVETLMHWDMADRGLKLINAGAPVTRHFNASKGWACLWFAWVFPRTFAARRVALHPEDRAKLALLWPLIPILRFRRLWPVAVQLLGFRRALTLIPRLFAGLVVSGASEGLGYLTKIGSNSGTYFDLEFHRDRFFTTGDRFPEPEELSTLAATNSCTAAEIV
jgi:hypothetical protein